MKRKLISALLLGVGTFAVIAGSNKTEITSSVIPTEMTYTLSAVCYGTPDQYVDTDGNGWIYEGNNWVSGAARTLYMSDNGTPNLIEDDKVLAVR